MESSWDSEDQAPSLQYKWTQGCKVSQEEQGIRPTASDHPQIWGAEKG